MSKTVFVCGGKFAIVRCSSPSGDSTVVHQFVDANGVLDPPIIHTSSDPTWAGVNAEIATCVTSSPTGSLDDQQISVSASSLDLEDGGSVPLKSCTDLAGNPLIKTLDS